jgi:hypothetical protein
MTGNNTPPPADSLVDRAREALADPDRGYFVVRALYSRDELLAYRDECTTSMKRAPRVHARLNTDWMPDYVHPRSHDAVARTYRLYQYLHNARSPVTTRVFDRTLAIRNAIEETWMADPVYRAEHEAQQDHVVVTRYVPGTGRLLPHRDYSGPATLPLIQSIALISQPGVDYHGGEFVLHTRTGRTVRLTDDLKVELGDLFLFDKVLLHEVEPTLPATTAVGRWSASNGSPARRHSMAEYLRGRLLYSDPVYQLWHPVWERFRQRGGAGKPGEAY